ncbi:MAG: GNAT family N-acetyltransferase [Fimbriimonadaceae bacterium]|nr:GNAT family N-acetyltransferase [Alphaproteobacteria bacterium]
MNGLSMEGTPFEMRQHDVTITHAENRENASMLDFAFIESFQALEQIKQDWTALDAAAGNPANVFQTFPWCWHWAKYAAAGDNPSWRLKILTGRRARQLVFVWPLAIPRGALINEARWLGEPLTQYGDVILADDPARDLWLLEAWRYINDQKDIDILHLHKVRDDANIHPLLSGQAHKLPGGDTAPYIDLTPYNNFAELNQTYNSKRRRNRARYRRRLQELGTLHFEIFQPCTKAEPALATALKFKNAWLKDTGRHNTSFSNPETVATLHSMVSGAEHPLGCLISVMHIDHEPLSIEIGFVNKNWYFCHIGAFNPWFKAHSPGNLQLEDTIGDLIDRGFDTFDLMAPEDRYKTEWANNRVAVSDYAAPVTLRGITHLGLYLKVLRPGLKTLYKKMPSVLKRTAARFI